MRLRELRLFFVAVWRVLSLFWNWVWGVELRLGIGGGIGSGILSLQWDWNSVELGSRIAIGIERDWERCDFLDWNIKANIFDLGYGC